MAKANDLFEKALQAEGISGQLADVARSIYMQESSGGKNATTSNAGAHGGMQIIPSTFKSVADKGWDINNPEQNARAGIRYLKHLDKVSGGDARLTAVGYYGGEGGMAKAKKGIAVSDPRNPKAPNTLQYADQVVARIGRETSGSVGKNPGVAAPPAVVATAPIPAAAAGAPAPSQYVEPLPPEPVQIAASSVPKAIGNQAENEWAEFQQSLVQRKKVAAESLASYGKGVPANPIRAVDPTQSLFGSPQLQPVRKVDFSAFGRWGAQA